MSSRVVTVAPDESANAAWTRMRRRRIRHLVVMQEGRLAGVVSERDLGGRAGASMRRGRTVRSLMTRTVVSANAETTVREAADLMRERLIGSLPVMQGDRLVGLVTATDGAPSPGSDRRRARGRPRFSHPTGRSESRSRRTCPGPARRRSAVRKHRWYPRTSAHSVSTSMTTHGSTSGASWG